jgi:general secretion pathway protein G
MGMKKPVVRHCRSRERATTLVEVLIVVAIIAMVAGGVGVAAFAYWGKAKLKTTATDARTVRHAVRAWRMEHDAAGCPKFDELRQAGMLESDGRSGDAWGQPWHIQCSESDVSVVSAGEDHKLDTPDDIRVPDAGESMRAL